MQCHKKNTIETIAFHTSKRVKKNNLSHLKEGKNLVEFFAGPNFSEINCGCH